MRLRIYAGKLWSVESRGSTRDRRRRALRMASNTPGCAPRALPGQRAALEPLESRRLLSGAIGQAAPPLLPVGAGSINGIIWTDTNANGIWDAPDGLAAGWTVYLDLNNDGRLDPGDPVAITTPIGWYTLAGLPAGTYTIRYLAPDQTWHPAPRQPDHLTITLSVAQIAVDESLGVTEANGQITGRVIDVSGTAALPIQHWGVYIDTNNNGQIDPGEPWTSTDSSGNFSFTNLLAGTYTVRVDPLHGGWSAVSPSSGSITINSDGVHASAAVVFAYRQAAPPAQYQVNQLVDYLLIGGGSSNAANRYVDQAALGNGWGPYTHRVVKPDIDWGVQRILLDNPFGVMANGYFQADQFLQAQSAGLTWLTDDFVQAWRPVAQSGVEVIAYIGNPDAESTFQALTSDPAAWNARFDASVAPFVQAGISIAFDLGQRFSPGDLFNQALDQLKGEGVKVYLENRPTEYTSYNWQFPIIAVQPGWVSTNPYMDSTQWWAAKNSELPGGGDVVRLLQWPPTGESWSDKTWLVSDLQSVFQDGDSAGVSISTLRADGLTLDDVLTPLGVHSTVPGSNGLVALPTPLGAAAPGKANLRELILGRVMTALRRLTQTVAPALLPMQSR